MREPVLSRATKKSDVRIAGVCLVFLLSWLLLPSPSRADRPTEQVRTTVGPRAKVIHALNRDGFTRGLCGQFTHVYHLQDERKVLACHRWDNGGPADDVVVVANFLNERRWLRHRLPAAGTWKLRFNSDWQGYSEDFEGHRRQRGHRTGRVRRLTLPRHVFYWSLQRTDLFAMIEGVSSRALVTTKPA
jgi:hypothetical protein